MYQNWKHELFKREQDVLCILLPGLFLQSLPKSHPSHWNRHLIQTKVMLEWCSMECRRRTRQVNQLLTKSAICEYSADILSRQNDKIKNDLVKQSLAKPKDKNKKELLCHCGGGVHMTCTRRHCKAKSCPPCLERNSNHLNSLLLLGGHSYQGWRPSLIKLEAIAIKSLLLLADWRACPKSDTGWMNPCWRSTRFREQSGDTP